MEQKNLTKQTEEENMRSGLRTRQFFQDYHLYTLQDVLDLTILQLQQISNSSSCDLGELRFEVLNYIDKNINNNLKFTYKEGYHSFAIEEYDFNILKKILKDAIDELDFHFRYEILESELNPKLFYTKRLATLLSHSRINISNAENLIKLGATINSNMLIQNYHKPEIIDFLLRHGADPSHDKEAILRFLASRCLHKKTLDNEDFIKCANLIVKYGASIPNAISYAKEKHASEYIIQNLEDFLDSFPIPDAKVAK